MKEKPNPKQNDPNTEREASKRAGQSARKSRTGEAPLKQHGQPDWREVKVD